MSNVTHIRDAKGMSPETLLEELQKDAEHIDCIAISYMAKDGEAKVCWSVMPVMQLVTLLKVLELDVNDAVADAKE